MRERALATAVAVLISGPALAEPATDLRPVTVTATRSEHAQAEAPASVTVITAEEIKAKGATDVLEAIRGTPGITLTGHGLGGRKTVTIRGAEDRHTLFLVDGRRITSTDDVIGHSNYQYGWVSMDQVERIEIVRGPMSALYGSEAMGGVINIITKKGGNKWRGAISGRGEAAQGAGGDSRQESLSVSGPLGAGFGLALSVEDQRRTPVPLKEDLWQSEIEGVERRNGTLGLTYEPVDGHQFSLDLLNSREERWRDTRSTSGAKPYYRDFYDLNRRQKSVGYRGNFAGVRPELRVTRSDFAVTNTRTSNVAPTRPQYLQDDVAEANVGFGLGSANMVTLGGELREERLENAGLRGGSDSAARKALFVQDEIELAKDWSLTFGLRNDNHEMFGDELSPRAYLVWKATPALTLKGGYGEAFRAPTLKQISPNYVGAEGPHTFRGNANIKPETSRSVEIGADFQMGGTEATAAIFRNDIDDLIYTRLTAPNNYIYDNLSKARIDGLETRVKQALGGGFSASANYTLLYATDRDTGATLVGRPRHTLTPTLEWKEGPWFTALSAEYVGDQWLSTTSNGNQPAPSYTLWNLNSRFDINEDASLRAGLRNITDVRLAEESSLFSYAEQGRSAYMAVDLKF